MGQTGQSCVSECWQELWLPLWRKVVFWPFCCLFLWKQCWLLLLTRKKSRVSLALSYSARGPGATKTRVLRTSSAWDSKEPYFGNKPLRLLLEVRNQGKCLLIRCYPASCWVVLDVFWEPRRRRKLQLLTINTKPPSHHTFAKQRNTHLLVQCHDLILAGNVPQLPGLSAKLPRPLWLA